MTTLQYKTALVTGASRARIAGDERDVVAADVRPPVPGEGVGGEELRAATGPRRSRQRYRSPRLRQARARRPWITTEELQQTRPSPWPGATFEFTLPFNSGNRPG